MITERERKELREYGNRLFNKIEHEHFSMKKLLHLYEYSCVCENLAHNSWAN